MSDTQTYTHCQLKSELARYCLPEAKRDPNRKLAWVNSICILFLLIGVFGSKPGTMDIQKSPPIEQLIPIVVEPPSPTRIEAQQNHEPTEQPKPDAPAVVVVTLETPAINFSVPTIGQLVVPNAIAIAPPANPLKPIEPINNQPTRIGNTGQGGDRPAPTGDDYPHMAKQLHQQGPLEVLIIVNAEGSPTDVQIVASSGSAILDRFTVDWVKRRWTLGTGTAGRQFIAPFRYSLQN